MTVSVLSVCMIISKIFLGLTLSFLSADTNVGESEGHFTVHLMIREAQIPFTLTLTPTTVDDVLADARITLTDCLTEAYSRLSPAGKASPGDSETELGLFVQACSNKRKKNSSGPGVG